MILFLAASAAAQLPLGVDYLECQMPGRLGKTTSWKIRLDEAHGSVEATINAMLGPHRQTAVYKPDSIRFELYDASITINRTSGTITKRLIDRRVAHESEGICVAAQLTKPLTRSGAVEGAGSTKPR